LLGGADGRPWIQADSREFKQIQANSQKLKQVKAN
jgi:hypothetical protein